MSWTSFDAIRRPVPRMSTPAVTWPVISKPRIVTRSSTRSLEENPKLRTAPPSITGGDGPYPSNVTPVDVLVSATDSGYRPEATRTTSPSRASDAAAVIVRRGAASAPEAPSCPVGATYHVVGVAASASGAVAAHTTSNAAVRQASRAARTPRSAGERRMSRIGVGTMAGLPSASARHGALTSPGCGSTHVRLTAVAEVPLCAAARASAEGRTWWFVPGPAVIRGPSSPRRAGSPRRRRSVRRRGPCAPAASARAGGRPGVAGLVERIVDPGQRAVASREGVDGLELPVAGDGGPGALGGVQRHVRPPARQVQQVRRCSSARSSQPLHQARRSGRENFRCAAV